MSYDKQNWQTGDVITANKLNHIEDGIANGGGVLVVGATMEGQTITLDKTWQEIFDAPFAVLRPVTEGEIAVYIPREFKDFGDEGYTVTFLNLADVEQYMDFTCNTADEYPTFTF